MAIRRSLCFVWGAVFGAFSATIVRPVELARVEYVPIEATSGRSLNLLIGNGWIILDPDGFPVDCFDER